MSANQAITKSNELSGAPNVDNYIREFEGDCGGRHLRYFLPHEAEEIAAKLLRVKAHTQILYAEDASPIDDGGKERVVDGAVGSA